MYAKSLVMDKLRYLICPMFFVMLIEWSFVVVVNYSHIIYIHIHIQSKIQTPIYTTSITIPKYI